jgi:hypothetical protein
VALAGVEQPLADRPHAQGLAAPASVPLAAGLARLAWEVVRGAPARRPPGLVG